MSDDDDNKLVEDVARAFCEASGLYSWADTPEGFFVLGIARTARAAIAVVNSRKR